MTELLDKFTNLLAYVGDEGAKDGYFLRTNNSGNRVYSVPIREEPMKDLENLVKKIRGFLQKGKLVKDVPADVLEKITELKKVFDSSHEKEELIKYMKDYDSSGMQGGTRKKKRPKRKTLKARR